MCVRNCTLKLRAYAIIYIYLPTNCEHEHGNITEPKFGKL